MERRTLKKGEMLLEVGQVARHIAFVESGMLRQLYYKNGHDITEHFACEGDGLCSLLSLFRQEKSKQIIEALEPSSVLLIPYGELVELSYKSKVMNSFLRLILESSLIMSQKKADSWRFETSRERYERFVKEYPEAAKRAHISHIASYLLMTPESLSRVRAGKL
ncbi:MAG TPA: Crp/Fnr family transcriptional regulator [Bacteroidales bacterium]|nr:Crp/Fnr family transcriptional regulator [Bacteroidales bacterium]